MRSTPCESRLISFALRALEEAAAQARQEPVRRTWAVRLALAYLASRTKPGHQAHDWAFDLYWKSLTANRVQERWGKMNAALNGIYLGVGRKRERRLEVVGDRFVPLCHFKMDSTHFWMNSLRGRFPLLLSTTL
jgi:hypothetical protein